jgi:hypothetical protein
VAELIVGAPLLGVAEHLVGLVDLLEAVGGAVLVVDIRMVLPGKTAKGLADIVLAGAAIDAQHLVVISLRGHVP